MSPLQKAFEQFREQCIFIRVQYINFINLFESGEEVLDVLEKSAIHFFQDINVILANYLYLQIGNITDPASTFGKDNLTSNFLDRELKNLGLWNSDIEKYSAAILHYRSLIILARNKRVAHFDKEAALNNEDIGEHTQNDVDEFFKNLQRYNDAVAIALGLSPVDFQGISGPGDVLDLIKVLKEDL